jgi:hypothetical protein
MEEKFLLHLLYIALIDIRARSYEQNDRKIFWLCDLLHEVPLQLASEEGTRKAYNSLSEKVKALGIEHWLETRKEEFYDQYPEYKK